MADYLIKNVRILDLKGNKDKYGDILVQDGSIVKIGSGIVPDGETTVIEGGGRYVTAGWIDAHVHAYVGPGSIGIDRDQYLKDGVTYVVEAGTAGPDNFEDYLRTSVMGKKMPGKSYLNLAPMGCIKEYGELTDIEKVDLEACEQMIQKYPEEIIGVKLRIDPRVCEEPKKAMELISSLSIRTGRPLIVHASRCSAMETGEILAFMKEGDIFAHTFADKAPGILDEDQNVKACVWDARKRGVKFDLSHGKSNFSFQTAMTAFNQGFLPDAISTDLHQGSAGIVESLALTISKVLACGLDLKTVLRLVTTNAADMLSVTDKSTEVSVGGPADLTVFSVEEGNYILKDSDGKEQAGDYLVKPYCTILGEECYWN